MKYLYYLLVGLTVVAITVAMAPVMSAVFLVLLAIGFYYPNLLCWNKKTLAKKRKDVVKYYGTLAVFALVIVFINGDGRLFNPNQSGGEVNGQEHFLTGEHLEVHFIDVGQGDAILVDYGDFELLIDGGDNHYGEEVVAYLEKQKIEELEYVVATHMDADHIGGLDYVFENFVVENVIDSGSSKNTKTYQDYQAARIDEGASYKEDHEQLKVVVDDQLWFRTIETGDEYSHENDNSVVVELNYGKRKLLFTGDMEEAAEQSSIHKFRAVDVLKSGHHGSRTSSSEAFLKQIKPQYAVISCGQDNKYNHPHQETLNKYKKYGIEVYRTDEMGDIVLKIAKDGTMTWE